MYAGYNIKGELKTFAHFPNSWHSKYGNVLGGFENLNEEEKNKHGVYPIQDIEIDNTFESKGELYFDQQQKVFTYKKIKREGLPTIEKAKKDLIKAINEQARLFLQKTDYYILESLELNIPIPNDIQSKRQNIRKDRDSKIEKIENISNLRELLEYKI